MTSGSKPKRIVLCLILFFTALGITLANATTEDNYKNDTILLPRTCETTLTENGYKANIIINPYTTGTYAKESNFNLDLTINPQGIGGAFTENNYKLDLIPENTLPDIRVPAHDVAVTNVTPSKTVIGQGYSMYINVTVENQGDFTETFNVTAYYGNVTITPAQWDTFWSMGDVNEDGYINMTDYNLIADHFGTTDPQYDINESGLVDMDDLLICAINQGLDIWTYFNILGGSIGRQTVIDLSPRDSTTLVFLWDTTGILYGNYTVSARATEVIGEINITNNVYSDGWVVVTILGDVNGDYIVDGSDLSDLNKAYGSTPNKPNWNPNCDLNDDYKVDASDLFELSKNYGKTV